MEEFSFGEGRRRMSQQGARKKKPFLGVQNNCLALSFKKLRTLLHKFPLPQKLVSFYTGFMLIAEYYEG